MAKRIKDPDSLRIVLRKSSKNEVNPSTVTPELLLQIKRRKIPGIEHVTEQKGPGILRLVKKST